MKIIDFRALCAELLRALIEYGNDIHYHEYHGLIQDAETALDQSAAAGPTEDDFRAWWRQQAHPGTAPSPDLQQTAMAWAAFCLARWGRPAVAPVAVDERLPEPEDCAPWPDSPSCLWCWAGRVLYGAWEWAQLGIDHASKDLGRSMRGQGWTHWLPWWALPRPQSRPTEQQP